MVKKTWKNYRIDFDREYSGRQGLKGVRVDGPVYKVFGKACPVCGWDKAILDIHHIIKKDTVRSIIPLCPNCHRLAELGKIKKKDLKVIQQKLLDLYDTKQEIKRQFEGDHDL